MREPTSIFAVGAKYNIYTDLISTAAIIAALFLTKNVFWLITAFIVSNTFLNCFFDYLTKIRFRPNKKEDPETIKYAKHLSLAGVISLMGDYLDRILLFNLAGPVQLAVYSFAMIMPEQIKGFMGNISTNKVSSMQVTRRSHATHRRNIGYLSSRMKIFPRRSVSPFLRQKTKHFLRTMVLMGGLLHVRERFVWSMV